MKNDQSRFNIESYYYKPCKILPEDNEYVVIIYIDGQFEKAKYDKKLDKFIDPYTELEFSEPKYWLRFKKI